MAEVSPASRHQGGVDLQAFLDRAAVREAVEHWGLWRDSGRFEQLRSLYTPDAIVHTTWFVGSAAEFIERSSKGRGRSQHFIGAVCVDLNGDRAIAETRAMLLLRAAVHDVEVDVTGYLRFYDWFVRTDAGWRIRMRNGIYEKDRMDPVDPAKTLSLDPEVLARHPAGYRHIAYVQASGGARITADLPTPGSAALARLYSEGEQWLREGTC
jgi:hypothetical protein